MDNYKILNYINSGRFGKIFKVEKDFNIFAMKEMDLNLNEVKILEILKDNDNVIKLFNYFIDNEKLYMIIEYCNEGTLFDIIRKNRNGIEDSHKLNMISLQLINGLEFIHKMNIVHSDIKPENILIRDGILKYADFGASFKISENPKIREGTAMYFSPEICDELLNKKVVITEVKEFQKSDVWALIFLIYELAHGIDNLPINFHDLYNNNEIIKKILNTKKEDLKPPKMKDSFGKFLYLCIDINYVTRYNITEVKNLFIKI